MKLLLIPLIITLLSVVRGYHYDDYPYSNYWKEAPRYPDYCCPLEWVNITNGQELPEDRIYAGTFMDRNFVFTRVGHPYLHTGVKSSRKEEPPYGFSHAFPNLFPILTNPNKCIIDWYTTKAHKDISQSNEEIFFPNNGWSKYGSYANYDGIPGFMNSNGDFVKMTSLSTHESYGSGGVKLLYVDCKKSFQSMYNYKLVNLSFDQTSLNELTSSNKRVLHVKKEYRNESPTNSIASFKFSVVTQDRLNMSLKNPHTHIPFKASDETYADWINGIRINQLLSDIKFDTGKHNHYDMWKISVKESEIQEIFGVYHEERFDFAHEITIPASSKVVVTAFAQPVAGRIPIKAIYEITPNKAGDNLITHETIRLNIEKYDLSGAYRFERTDGGKYQVNYDGIMDIDSGNEVHLEIKRLPLNGLSESDGSPIGADLNEPTN